jgi:uncharacterized protein (DUF1330 family)
MACCPLRSVKTDRGYAGRPAFPADDAQVSLLRRSFNTIRNSHEKHASGQPPPWQAIRTKNRERFMQTPTPDESERGTHRTAAPAYAIGHITVRDPAGWQDYCRQVPATLAPFNGEVMLRGQVHDVLHGAHAHVHTVVLRFPDTAAAAGWHASPAYQALVPLRDAAADVVLVSYQGQEAA